MKTGALIVSLLFVTLMVQPLFISWDAKAGCGGNTQKSCCKKKDAAKEHPAKNEQDPCRACNPFMACNTCGYLLPEKQDIFAPWVPQSAPKAAAPKTDLSSYNDDWWHPPELFLVL